MLPSAAMPIIALAIVLAAGETPYDIQPAPHAVTTLTLFGVLGVYSAFVKGEFQGGLTCDVEPGTTHCDPSRLNALDRTVVGRRNDAWLLATDLSAGAIFAGAA